MTTENAQKRAAMFEVYMWYETHKTISKLKRIPAMMSWAGATHEEVIDFLKGINYEKVT